MFIRFLFGIFLLGSLFMRFFFLKYTFKFIYLRSRKMEWFKGKDFFQLIGHIPGAQDCAGWKPGACLSLYQGMNYFSFIYNSPECTLVGKQSLDLSSATFLWEAGVVHDIFTAEPNVYVFMRFLYSDFLQNFPNISFTLCFIKTMSIKIQIQFIQVILSNTLLTSLTHVVMAVQDGVREYAVVLIQTGILES